jgi:ubiquitin C-terminal hydrolase
MDTGHYTSYLRHEDRWYLCDDASVSIVPEAVVLSGHKAYMAFYQRSVTQRQG